MSEGDPPLTDQEYRALAALRREIRVFLRTAEEQARAAGITPQQYLLLLIVRGHPSYPDVAVGDIAEGLQVRHHSASVLVDRMVKRGLLQRREDPGDRRRVIVGLTERGLHILDDVTRASHRELSGAYQLLAGAQSETAYHDAPVQP